MVKALHAAGIEVILDVVYNHTAEGNHLGPDAEPQGHRQPRPTTGSSTISRSSTWTTPAPATASTCAARRRLQLIMDSLRYWVTEMHVDGFRFDLASTLAREFYDVDRLSTFFEVVQQDPVVGQVKLIAEPWDVGPGGYQVGNFPPNWTEWNGKYRDTVRDFWRGEPATLAEFASRITGSADLYQDDGRKPFHSHQLRHRARRLHPQRPGLLQRQAQRGQRRGEPGRREPQPVLELRRRGPDRRPGGARAARPAAAQLPGHPDAQPGRADDLARRRAGPHPAAATTTPTARTTRSAWIDWDNADEQLLEFTRKLTAFRHRHQVFQPPPVLHRPAGDRPRRRRPAARPGLVHPGRPADGRRRLGQRLRPGGRAVRQRRGHPRARPVRPAARRQLVPALLQRARRAHRVRHAPGRVRREVGEGHRDRRAVAGPTRRSSRPARKILVPDRSLIVLDRTV